MVWLNLVEPVQEGKVMAFGEKVVTNDVFTAINARVKWIWGVIYFFLLALSESTIFLKIS